VIVGAGPLKSVTASGPPWRSSGNEVNTDEDVVVADSEIVSGPGVATVEMIGTVTDSIATPAGKKAEPLARREKWIIWTNALTAADSASGCSHLKFPRAPIGSARPTPVTTRCQSKNDD
jgi:hypothetical protein